MDGTCKFSVGIFFIFSLISFSNSSSLYLKEIFAFLTGTVMQISVISVPFLANIFKTVSLTAFQWIIVAILSLIPLLVVETEKFIVSKQKSHKNILKKC